MKKILIIDDELPILELIKLNLHMAGFDTLEAMDGEEALNIIKKKDIDLILLDIMLPKIDGYTLVPYIIKKSIPFIMLSAKSGLANTVHGLNLGADDYITKPFEALELVARINSVLRRNKDKENVKEFDDIKIFSEQRKVFKDSKEIELTLKEFELLEYFLMNKGISISRDKILQNVWNYDYAGNTRTVDIHVKNLRDKLRTERIKTVYKYGYRLEV